MKNKVYIVLLSLLLLAHPRGVFAGAAVDEYLCEVGISFYNRQVYDDALSEFKKALIVNPENKTARRYIDLIFQEQNSSSEIKETNSPKVEPAKPLKVEVPVTAQAKPVIAQAVVQPQAEPQMSREMTIDKTLESLGQSKQVRPRAQAQPAAVKPAPQSGPKSDAKKEKKEAGIEVSGEVQASLGVTPDYITTNKADGNLNEENWRTLNDTGLNRRADTFDPRIYDRLQVKVDRAPAEGFGFHTNITVDPWSYTGKSGRTTVTGVDPQVDTGQVELLAWGNSNYTVPHTVYTTQRGDAFSLGERKIRNNEVNSYNITSTNGNIFTIPDTKIGYQFQPLRELWVDYTQPGMQFRVFPIAYENQAYTSDDPLKVSNNHSWVQESPWLSAWLPGNYNAGTGVNDFRRGKWDDSLAYLARDSDGQRLTALRGASLSFSPWEETSFATTIAAPKQVWDDYGQVDNIISASRLKHKLTDNLGLGLTYTYRVGYRDEETDNRKRDIANHVFSADVGYEVVEGLKSSFQVAASRTEKDLTTPAYSSRLRGNAYYFSLVGRLPQSGIMDLNNGYDEIKQGKTEGFFGKFRLFLAHMDEGFDPALANYHETRDDSFWGRHLQFRRPFDYYYAGLYNPSVGYESIDPYRIGNGIDIGRDVVGFRVENTLFNNKIGNLFDLRNVHSVRGKFIENTSRDEIILRPDGKWTLKFLGLYQAMPKTKGGVDPFVTDNLTGEYVLNAAVADGVDPSLKTGSAGAEYAFFDWLSLNGVYERTNDSTVAYDNFPRGNLSGSSFAPFFEDGNKYRRDNPFLYSQGLFPPPPYKYFNIFKTGLRISPVDKLQFYIDYTRNEFKSAGQIDDNMNHIGFEAGYLPTKKLGLYFKYVYSRWNDLTLMQQGYDKIYLSHHDFFGELRYLPTGDDELVFQYGESGRSNVITTYSDPFNTGQPVLDTQHIVRLYYRRKF